MLTKSKRVGFLTYDLQWFTEDCIYRIASALKPIKLKAFPVIYHPNQTNARFDYLPSKQRGRYMGVTVEGSTPEGFASNINWRAAWGCVRDSDVVVLFGLQGATALLTVGLGMIWGRTLISVNQTLPIDWELKRRWWIRLLKGWLLSRCRLHIWQTPATLPVLENVYHIERDKMIHAPFEAGATTFREVLHNAIETSTRVRSELNIADETVFLFVGNLHPFKGVPMLLEAAAQMAAGANFICVFAGPEGPENVTGGTIGYYIQLGRELGIEKHIRFTGKLAPERLAALYFACDVVVLPTSKDCFPKVLVEGALAGKPLITTSANGAAGAIVVDGENGFVVEPGNVTSLARAMEAMLEPRLCETMGRRSLKLVNTLCDPEAETAGFLQAIHRALAGR